MSSTTAIQYMRDIDSEEQRNLAIDIRANLVYFLENCSLQCVRI